MWGGVCRISVPGPVYTAAAVAVVAAVAVAAAVVVDLSPVTPHPQPLTSLAPPPNAQPTPQQSLKTQSPLATVTATASTAGTIQSPAAYSRYTIFIDQVVSNPIFHTSVLQREVLSLWSAFRYVSKGSEFSILKERCKLCTE